MSKGRKSSYPERPAKKGRPKSSENRHRKGRVWIARPDINPVPKNLEGERIDLSRCVAGHNPPGMSAFLSKYRANKVPGYGWGINGENRKGARLI